MMRRTGDDPLAVWRARLRAHLCGRAQGRAAGAAGIDRRCRSRALPALRRARCCARRRRKRRRPPWRRAALAPAAAQGQGADLVRLAKASDDLCRRRRLSRLEDQPPRRHADRGQALAAALADPRRAHSAASAVAARRDPLTPPRPARSATARGERVDGERLPQHVAAGEVAGVARLADIAGDEQHGDRRDRGARPRRRARCRSFPASSRR